MGKVKEIKRTANVAWSPKQLQSIFLAGGTVAQQLDATFSTSAYIEIFSLDLTSSGKEMQCVGRVQSKYRFHKINWSGLGLSDGSHPKGIVVGGSDNGTITLWDAAKIVQSQADEALICQTEQHVGPVRTLDINPFQPNLLASGASESEIYIWDLNNPMSPMSPGNKLHPLEDITCVAWNRQAQHILGSTSPSGRSVVWDLRKNEPIIQVSDSSSRIHCKALSWHPDIPTQLVTGSEDDRSPVIQLWDLRFATSPMRVLERHKRGVLSLAWCQQDADLLLSAAKDNQVLCWNPNTNMQDGEVVYQLPATSQWIFEVQWCPRNPDIICTSSFDGHISLYSLLGGGGASQEAKGPDTPTQVDPNDPFAGIAQAQKMPEIEDKPLKTPPKWFRRPCAANFGFGGRLVSFGSKSQTVSISQVVTEPSLLQQSNEFESAVEKKLFAELCTRRMESGGSEREQKIWSFLKANFDSDPRRQYLELLGYNAQEMEKQFSLLPESSLPKTQPEADLNVKKLQEKLATLPLEEEEKEEEQEEEEEEEEEPEDVNSTAGLFGSEGGQGSANIFDDIGSSSSTHESVLPSRTTTGAKVSLLTGDDPDGMLTKALLVGNFRAAVNICINTGRMAEAIILSVAGGSELYESTQQHFFKQSDTQITQLISLVTNRKWDEIVKNGNLDNWNEILASLVTYATPDEFSPLCNDLGRRLENNGCYDDALLCYICSGNVDKFVDCWMITMNEEIVEPLVLHDLVEKVVLLRCAIHKGTRKETTPITNIALAERIRSYADLLAAQGDLKTALSYLELTLSSQVETEVLHDRLYHSSGSESRGGKAPPFPFERVTIGSQALSQSRATQYTNGPMADGQLNQPPTNPYQRTPISQYPGAEFGGQTPPTGQYIVGGGGVANLYTGATYTRGNVADRIAGHNPPSDTYSVAPPTSLYSSTHSPLSMPPSVPMVPPTAPTSVPNVPMIPTTTPHAPTMFPPSSSVSKPPLFQPSSYTSQTSPMAPPPTFSSSSTGCAWNDPPMLKKVTKTSTYTAPAPLTVPLVPSQEPIQPPVPPTGGTHPLPVRELKPGTPVEQQAPSSPITPIEKKPVPAEHQVIPTVLEGLLTQCRTRANNAVMRRKAEEIGRKLDILSDLLRESRLSPEILQGLHYITQDCQSVNYQSALARLNHMVASSNLSEISSFLPGIKTLLQLVIQLRV